jgi:hypothetical protein
LQEVLHIVGIESQHRRGAAGKAYGLRSSPA